LSDALQIPGDVAVTNQPSRSADTPYIRRMQRLLNAIQELSLARGMPEIQKIVRMTARELAGADGATFILRDKGLCYYADEDAIAPLWKGRRFPMDDCISGWVMKHRQPALIRDIYSDDRIPVVAYQPTFVRSLAVVPIRTREPIGAIGNYWARMHSPSRFDLMLLQGLADATSVAIENAELYAELEVRVEERTRALADAQHELERLSVTDELTGLSNRRGFYREAAAMLAGGGRFVFVYLDVDGLKGVNDAHGHAAGDALIRDVAQRLAQNFEANDVLGRVGGDEFCVLASDADGDPDRLERKLSQSFVGLGGGPSASHPVSVSLGMLRAFGGDDETVDGLIARADELMYRDKQAKRLAKAG
jgi:diguanylate cyclase (GGDEF)-like protein